MMKNSPEFSRDREFTVVLESIRSDFRVFGEGLEVLARRVDGLDRKVGGLDRKVDAMSVNLARTMEGVTEIRSDIKTINGQLDRLESARA